MRRHRAHGRDTLHQLRKRLPPCGPPRNPQPRRNPNPRRHPKNMFLASGDRTYPHAPCHLGSHYAGRALPNDNLATAPSHSAVGVANRRGVR
eukprot:1779909-Prymnesium_polylepis.2